MWEHGMPGSAWSMAADLLRWEELDERDAAADASPVAEEPPRRRPRPGRRIVWRWRPGTVTS